MIQRIQTVYLAIAGACLTALFLAPNQFLAVVSTGETGQPIANFYSNLAGPIMLGLAAIATFGAIFLFGARPSQVKVARLALLDTFLFVVIAGLLAYVDFQKSTAAPEVRYGWALALPVVAMLCQFLALRAIRSDEALVKSADRLR